MTVDSRPLYVCDRCGKTQRSSGLPSSWWRLTIDGTAKGEQIKDLCYRCSCDLDRLMRETPPTEALQ